MFGLASKVDKGKSKPKTEESIAKRVKLKNNWIAEIEKEEKTWTMNCLITTLVNIKIQVIYRKYYARHKIKKWRSSIFNQRNIR